MIKPAIKKSLVFVEITPSWVCWVLGVVSFYKTSISLDEHLSQSFLFVLWEIYKEKNWKLRNKIQLIFEIFHARFLHNTFHLHISIQQSSTHELIHSTSQYPATCFHNEISACCQLMFVWHAAATSTIHCVNVSEMENEPTVKVG